MLFEPIHSTRSSDVRDGDLNWKLDNSKEESEFKSMKYNRHSARKRREVEIAGKISSGSYEEYRETSEEDMCLKERK